MPFTEDGVIPDLLINPHAIPSRMTVAHVLEMIGGKVGSMEGRKIDGTAFTGEKEESLRSGSSQERPQALWKENYDQRRDRRRASPSRLSLALSSTRGSTTWLVANCMLEVEVEYRSSQGQPTEGRARQGGLRFGEMERDCLISHGASMVIKDRLLDESDGWNLMVCNNSSMRAYRLL